MKSFLTKTGILSFFLLLGYYSAFSQCTNAPEGQWPTNTVALNQNANPTTLTTCAYTGEYSTVGGVQSGRSYTVGSSTATNYITITSADGLTVVAHGIQPFTFTSPSAADLRVYRHENAACDTDDIGCRIITMTCNNCIAPPPPPSLTNDECSGAIPLTVGATCTFTQYTNAGATDSQGAPAPGCASYAGGDVWFSVVVPAGGSVILDSNTGVITDSGMAIYSGTCGSLTLIECDDDDSGNGFMSRIVRSGLTPGSTIYVRFWEFGGDNNGTFSICASLPPNAPANDNCASAAVVIANPALTCTNVTPGTLAGATASTGATSTCGTYDDDVWFSFVATSATHQVELLNITGSTTDLTHQVLTSCGATTSLVCSDPNLSTVGGLTIGTTYYIRVASWTATAGQTSSFNVCVKTPPPPPANDLCANAIEFPCNGSVTGSTLFSTADAAPTCDGFANTSPGVWYKFTGTGFPVTISSCGGVTWDNKISVYTGSCGAFTCVAADDDDCDPGLQALVDFASTAGTTYYILVHGFLDAAGDFTLTLTTAQCNACKGTDPPRISNLTGTSTTINWNTVSGTTQYSYTVGTGLLLCPSSATVTNTASTSVNLTGLLPGTDYTVCVRANTCSGGTSPSAWSSVRFTTPGNCEAPSQPFVSGLTTSSATLTWPAVAGVTSYKYSRGSSSTCANGTLTTTGSNTVTLTGLTPGTTYYFCVQSDCGSSASGFVSARFTTLAAPGSRPAGTNEGDLMEYSVYPNPANEDINLALNNFPAGKNVNVQIINQLGQTMVTHRFTNESNHVETIKVDQLPDGIYIMSVQAAGTEQKFKKFVKGALRP